MDKPTLSKELPPVPINGCWMPGPANRNDPVERDLVTVGDKFVVLVNCVVRHQNGTKKNYWDIHVITATEGGWDDPNGETWSAWSWDDVSWYLELTRDKLPQL